MLFRFCLYGFLKNQTYFAPFLILALRQKHLSFAMIGVLIGFREVCVALLEVPTGAIADVLGRRRAMITSFAAYIGSFAIFGLLQPLWALFVAMLLFAFGEAFRTGTHKAIIFDWLAHQGRESDKTTVYGRTRSWSKLGSAVSVVAAAAVVFATKDYAAVFLLCIIPYAANIVNFLTYPKYLDGPRAEHAGLAGVVRTLLASLRSSVRRPALRRLLAEAMGYSGLYKAGKDYLQPVLRSAALALPLLAGLADRRRTAVMVGAVYFGLYLLSSFASRGAGRFSSRAGGDSRAARWLWALAAVAFLLMGGGVLGRLWPVVIVAFVLLDVLQNLWRPILVSRIASHADRAQTATVLSIESQARSLFVAAVAPLLGWAVDAIAAADGDLRFLPIAALGLVISAGMLATGRTRGDLLEPPPAGKDNT